MNDRLGTRWSRIRNGDTSREAGCEGDLFEGTDFEGMDPPPRPTYAYDDMPWRIAALVDGAHPGSADDGLVDDTPDDDGSSKGNDRELVIVGPRWRRIGTSGLIAILALAVLGTAVGLQASDARRGHRVPRCQDPNSDFINDPVGDGYGWERGRVCRVRTNPTTATTAEVAAPTQPPGPPTTSAQVTSTSDTGPATTGSTPASTTATAPTKATAPGSTPATSAGGRPGSPAVSGDYQSNLKLIQAQKVRNRNEDDSPFRQTPSNQLVPEQHYGPRSDYLNIPAGNPEQDFPTPEGGQFRVACEFSHFAYDDPLVFPNQPGAAHLHMFFGNTDANAYSTADSILNSGGSTCNGQELNRTAYWAPAMFDGKGNVLTPERVAIYYKGEGLANGKAEPFPTGAAMIANVNINTLDNGAGGAMGKFSFVCSDNYSSPSDVEANTIPDNCDGSKFKNLYGADSDPRVVLEMNVKFPQCWNGQDPTNPANFSQPTDGGWYYSLCNGQFSHTLVNLEYFINYVVEPGENTSDWYLSSDVDPTTRTMRSGPGGSTVHADWWSGWHKQTNETFLKNCVNFSTSEPSGCGFGYLTNGGPDGNNPQPGPALKYRDQYTGPSRISAIDLYRELCPGGGNLANATAAAYCKPGTAGHH